MPAANSSVIDRVTAAMSLQQADRDQLEARVARYLDDRSPTVRARAIDVVRTRDLRVFEGRILSCLADKNRWVRYAAVECLEVFHEGEATSASYLYPLLDDPHFLVKIETLESLGQIRDKKSLPLVAARLEDRDPLVRGYAAHTIADLDGRRYVRRLQQRLLVEADERARVGLADALFYFGQDDQLSALLAFLSSDNYTVRCASANCLNAAELTAEQRRSVLDAISYAARNALFRADRTTMERVEHDMRAQEQPEGPDMRSSLG